MSRRGRFALAAYAGETSLAPLIHHSKGPNKQTPLASHDYPWLDPNEAKGLPVLTSHSSHMGDLDPEEGPSYRIGGIWGGTIAFVFSRRHRDISSGETLAQR